ncbi:FH2 domain-containing protein 1-like [Aquarana catesbeiana]|uniref:FH2 domain-containing protein 1-like n=1 Tax=Aquarana catesbeiana TaxID=8400 RepID=UPI003CCA3E00
MDETAPVNMVTSRNAPSPSIPPCPPPLPPGGLPTQPPPPTSSTGNSNPPPPPPPVRFLLPPPPPPPVRGSLIPVSINHTSVSSTTPSAPLRFGDQRRPKLRNFNWDALPVERVMGGRNLWTCGPQGTSLQIDVAHMEELFGQKEEPRKLRGQRSFKAQPVQGETEPEMTLLDSKRNMNLGIFLKQFKRPIHVMVEDIRRGVGSNFGAEKLGELQRLLPEKDEMKRLRAFKGDRSRLSDPELFMVMLVEIPSYLQRLQVMILKEEFFPQLNSLKHSVEIQTVAATELLECEELHTIIHLVLKAGNYMNAGGYAGSAMGFRMGSLLKLADTKANKPGMNLMHFVVQEAEKNNRALMSFPEKLTHISQASRITSLEVESDLENLTQRLQSTKEALRDQPDLKHEMAPFLQVAEVELCEVLCSLQSLRDTRCAVMDYFCEDESTCRLEDLCLIFTTFCAKFLAAAHDNKEREKAEHRKERLEKRRSIASCSLQDKDLQDVELEFLLLRLPRRRRPSRGPRPLPRSHSTEVLNSSPTKSPASTAAKVSEPIGEEDSPVPEKPQQGLRRPREDSTGSDGQQDTPGKMNRRHTLACLPYRGELDMHSMFVTSPSGRSQEFSRYDAESDNLSVSTPSTPTTSTSLSQILRSSNTDTPVRKDSSPTSGSPNSLRLGGLFQRRGSLKSSESLIMQGVDISPRGGNEASALATFFRRVDNALRSPK